MDDETQAGWEEKMAADEKYIEDLQKAYAQLKMENAALVNLIGGIIHAYGDHTDDNARRMYLTPGDLVAHYTVETTQAHDDGMDLKASTTHQDNE